jgi:hypothetical protein
MSDDLESILEPQFDYVNNLSDPIKAAILDYTAEAYRDLNERLRSGSILTSDQRRLLERIDQAFDRVPPTEQPIIVYRGVRGSFLPDIVSYVSTSYDPDVAISFAGTVCCYLKIIIPAGSHILPITGISKNPQESEILLPREGNFIITNTRSNHLDGVKSYDLVYVPENSLPLTDTTNLTQISQHPPLGVDLEIWVQRILQLISHDEIELFGAQDAVNSVVTTSLKPYSIPPEAVRIAVQRLATQST